MHLRLGWQRDHQAAGPYLLLVTPTPHGVEGSPGSESTSPAGTPTARGAEGPPGSRSTSPANDPNATEIPDVGFCETFLRLRV